MKHSPCVGAYRAASASARSTKGWHRRRDKRLTNVWELLRITHTKLLHPTEKPAELYRRFIEFSSVPGDLVVDPCCGSGPVGIAATATGRQFIGFDVDPMMVAIAQKRCGLPITVDVPEVVPIQVTTAASSDMVIG